MRDLPAAFRRLQTEHPAVHKAYEDAADATHQAGPLDDRTRRLVKLAIAVGGRLEGAVRSQARQAKDVGVSDQEIDHVVLLSLTTIGLPSMVAARTWVAEALSDAG